MKNKLTRITKKIFSNPSLVVSIIAIIISLCGIYFQFFNARHSVLYATLKPVIDSNSNQIIIPLILKNTGNQTEIILDSELYLEVINSEGNFFKRISQYSNKESFVILSPGDHKTIYLEGDYKQYMFGTIKHDFGKNDFRYYPITVFDNLLLKINIGYLTKYGTVAKEERDIGRITFNENEQITRLDGNPITLKRLNLKNRELRIMGFSIFPNSNIVNESAIDLTDPANFDKLQLINKILELQLENE